jgi:hypothetical protein
VGTGDEFVSWIASNEEAWCFLDAVDVAHECVIVTDNERNFERLHVVNPMRRAV